MTIAFLVAFALGALLLVGWWLNNILDGAIWASIRRWFKR